MIIKNSLFCKIIRIKTSSKSLFDTYMKQFRLELETCPICGNTGSCHIHDYYDRAIIDFRDGKKQKESLCVMRVFCESCGHAHAILPDIIIPYSSYSLLFILFILGEYFAGLYTIEQLCERFEVSEKQFYKWLNLWNSHRKQWFGMLEASETDNISFFRTIILHNHYSAFSREFLDLTAHSFLQSHRNPCLSGSKNAHYRQSVFAPDISIL